MKARDIMVTSFPTIRLKSTVGEAVKLLKSSFGDETYLNAAPGLIVQNDRGELAGVFTPLAVINLILQHREDAAREKDDFDAICRTVCKNRVETVMERQPISVTADASLEDVAELFSSHRFQRIPVVQGKKVVGIIYRSRLMFAMTRAILEEEQKP